MLTKQFRIYDKEQKELVYFDFDDILNVQFLDKWDYRVVWGERLHKNSIKYSLNEPTTIIKEEVDRFTGVFDENKTPIYENDIVLVQTNNYCKQTPEAMKACVVWGKEEEIGWGLSLLEPYNTYPDVEYMMISFFSYKVIDNIYENKIQ